MPPNHGVSEIALPEKAGDAARVTQLQCMIAHFAAFRPARELVNIDLAGKPLLLNYPYGLRETTSFVMSTVMQGRRNTWTDSPESLFFDFDPDPPRSTNCGCALAARKSLL